MAYRSCVSSLHTTLQCFQESKKNNYNQNRYVHFIATLYNLSSFYRETSKKQGKGYWHDGQQLTKYSKPWSHEVHQFTNKRFPYQRHFFRHFVYFCNNNIAYISVTDKQNGRILERYQTKYRY